VSLIIEVHSFEKIMIVNVIQYI